ncbi:hypothetical protein FRC01_009485 [Tulasnella sp. 417]|nr:hypothetical protein FRC01_009485 [Tulasnella sp. 417]
MDSQWAQYEHETTQLRDGLLYCIRILGQVLESSTILHSKMGLERKLKEFMELFSDGVKRRIGILDDCVILEVLRLEGHIMYSLSQEQESGEQLEDYQIIYLEIKSNLDEMGFIKPTDWSPPDPEFSPPLRSKNPADPPPAHWQAMQSEAGPSDPGKGKARLESTTPISLQEEEEDW